MEQNPFQNKQIEQEKLDVKVEIATEKDWEECKRLRIQAITGEDAKMFGSNIKRITSELEKGEKEWQELFGEDKFVVLSRDGSKAIGMVRAYETKEKGVWYIGQLYVDKDARKTGAGKKMMQESIEEIKRRGGRKISAFIKNNNIKSHNLCESFGFKKVNPLLLKDSLKVKFDILKRGFDPMELDLTK